MTGSRALCFVIASSCVVGCAHDRHTFSSAEVHRVVPVLRSAGSATVADLDGTRLRLSLDDRVEAHVPSGLELEELSLGALVGSCTDPETDWALSSTLGPDDARCPLVEQFTISHERLDVGTSILNWTGGVLLVGAVSGLAACGLLCDDPWNVASAVALGAAVVGIVVALVVALLTTPYQVPH